MTHKRPVGCLVVVLFLSMLLSVRATEKPLDVAACIANRHAKQCDYVIRYKGAKIYERSDTESNILKWPWGWGNSAQIDWARAKNTPDGWLPTWSGDYDKRKPYGWIQLKNLARLDEFKRVVGCWPIASIESGLGDSAAKFKFAPAVLRT